MTTRIQRIRLGTPSPTPHHSLGWWVLAVMAMVVILIVLLLTSSRIEDTIWVHPPIIHPAVPFLM
jgi:hypothetical protein